MLRYVITYAATLVAFIGLDAIYLSTIGGKLFRRTLGDVMMPSFTITPAILFYLIAPIGIVIFVLLPAFGTGAVDDGARLRRAVRFLHLLHLRHDQLGNDPELDPDDLDRRRRLGNGAECRNGDRGLLHRSLDRRDRLIVMPRGRLAAPSRRRDHRAARFGPGKNMLVRAA